MSHFEMYLTKFRVGKASHVAPGTPSSELWSHQAKQRSFLLGRRSRTHACSSPRLRVVRSCCVSWSTSARDTLHQFPAPSSSPHYLALCFLRIGVQSTRRIPTLPSGALSPPSGNHVQQHINGNLKRSRPGGMVHASLVCSHLISHRRIP